MSRSNSHTGVKRNTVGRRLVPLWNSLTSTGGGRNGVRSQRVSLLRGGERRPLASRAVARLAPGAAPLRTHSVTPYALLQVYFAATSNSIKLGHSFVFEERSFHLRISAGVIYTNYILLQLNWRNIEGVEWSDGAAHSSSSGRSRVCEDAARVYGGHLFARPCALSRPY